MWLHQKSLTGHILFHPPLLSIIYLCILTKIQLNVLLFITLHNYSLGIQNSYQPRHVGTIDCDNAWTVSRSCCYEWVTWADQDRVSSLGIFTQSICFRVGKWYKEKIDVYHLWPVRLGGLRQVFTCMIYLRALCFFFLIALLQDPELLEQLVETANVET